MSSQLGSHCIQNRMYNERGLNRVLLIVESTRSIPFDTEVHPRRPRENRPGELLMVLPGTQSGSVTYAPVLAKSRTRTRF